MSNPVIHASALTLAYDTRTVARDLTVDIPQGKVTAIIGANACGKSTLLRALSRLLKPNAGFVELDGKDVRKYSSKEFARKLGLLPQTSVAPSGITVADLVGRGRFPHQHVMQQWSNDDEQAVNRALHATGIAELADRLVDELSGGQRQRVWIALLLAQDSPVMLLDEPTTYLDISHQLEVMELVRALNVEESRTVVVVLHDLNQAARFADHLIVLRSGEVLAQGSPQDVMTEDLLARAFSLEARIVPDPVFGTPLVIPIRKLEQADD